jgi:hypothetical protein
MKAKKDTKYVSVRVWVGIACGVIAVCALTWFFVIRPRLTVPDTALARAVLYAQAMPELPRLDNTNLVRPDYNSFHRAHRPGFIRYYAHTLGIAPALWNASDLRGVLASTLLRLKSYGMYKDIVAKVTPKPGTRFVIWGDLSGAYHSLVRGLVQLKEMGIIDDSLKVIAPDTYILILGDAVSRSPYGMETLTLLLQLLEINSDTVLYLRGNHEDSKYWEAFGLKDQIELYCGSQAGEYVKAINELFLHFPLGLYIGVPDRAGHFVRISHLNRDESTKLKEDRYAHFLEARQVAGIDRHQIEKNMMQGGRITIDAVMHAEKKRHTFEATEGLRLLPADAGATTWTLVSAPTRVMQEGMKFFHDAFAIITVGDSYKDWNIAQVSRDVRTQEPFVEKEYFFFTGAAWQKDAQPSGQDSKPAAQAQSVALKPQELAPASERVRSPFVRMLAGTLFKKEKGAMPGPIAIRLG